MSRVCDKPLICYDSSECRADSLKNGYPEIRGRVGGCSAKSVPMHNVNQLLFNFETEGLKSINAALDEERSWNCQCTPMIPACESRVGIEYEPDL